MEDVESVMILDSEQHIIAAAHHIVKALETSKTISDEVRRILADLDTHLSKMTKISESETPRLRELEIKLKSTQKKVLSMQANHWRIWDLGPQALLDYLLAVNDIRKIIEDFQALASNTYEKRNQLVHQAYSLQQMAMLRLQEELVYILVQNMQRFEHEYVTFNSCEETAVDDESMVFTEDGLVEDASRRQSSCTESEEILTDLVHPGVVPHVKHIAKTMFVARYDQEFCQAFAGFWREALYEYIMLLKVGQFSIEDVLKMDWDSLNFIIKKWCRAVKNVTSFYLPSLKHLIDQVLGEFGNAGSDCFFEASKHPILRLLIFGQAVAVGPRLPERLFCLLDMYEVLAQHHHAATILFAESTGSLIGMEFQELLKDLGNSAKIIFVNLGNQIASRSTTIPLINGGICPIIKYIMNYITLVPEYGNILNILLEEDQEEIDSDAAKETALEVVAKTSCPLAHHLHSLTAVLLANLEDKSNLYKDDSLKHIFMMNNICYMVQKVKNSKVRIYLGDDWIKEHTGKFQQHEMIYERITWSSVLALLRNDGDKRKSIIKERCRSFSLAFEEIYKIQSGWCIPDIQLRLDLKVSCLQKVVHAYTTFIGRAIKSSISEKHIKYTASDLENHIMDLFEGSPKSLNHSRRR